MPPAASATEMNGHFTGSDPVVNDVGLDKCGLGEFYKRCTFISKPDGFDWFSFLDCLSRVTRMVFAYYLMMLIRPVSFFLYCFKYQTLHKGRLHGGALAFCLPFLPHIVLTSVFTSVVLARLRKLQRKYFQSTTRRKQSIWETNIFFIPPESFAAAVMWDFYKELNMFVGGFLLSGNDDMAVQASWVDTVTNKHYWRALLRGVGAAVPEKRAVWDGHTLEWAKGMGPDCVEGRDLVLKLHNSYLGIGDRFLEHGKDFNSAADLEALIRTKYPADSLTGDPLEADSDNDAAIAAATEATQGAAEGAQTQQKAAPPTEGALLIMDWVRPKRGIEPAPSNDVHQLDILTLRVPGKGVQLVSCVYWGDCTTATTHSSRSGFVCDVENETIYEKAEWYGPYFSTFVPKDGTLGRRIPGMRESVALAIRAHEQIDLPFLSAVGWDVMITDKGPVFFEGNYGVSRMPRRIFLNWGNLFWFLARYALGPPSPTTAPKPKSQ